MSKEQYGTCFVTNLEAVRLFTFRLTKKQLFSTYVLSRSVWLSREFARASLQQTIEKKEYVVNLIQDLKLYAITKEQLSQKEFTEILQLYLDGKLCMIFLKKKSRRLKRFSSKTKLTYALNEDGSLPNFRCVNTQNFAKREFGSKDQNCIPTLQFYQSIFEKLFLNDNVESRRQNFEAIKKSVNAFRDKFMVTPVFSHLLGDCKQLAGRLNS